MVQEVLTDEKIKAFTPILRVGSEGKPMKEEKRQGQVLFQQRRILRLEAKVSGCKMGIPRGEMHRFVISGRVGADEQGALDQKETTRASPVPKVARVTASGLTSRTQKAWMAAISGN